LRIAVAGREVLNDRMPARSGAHLVDVTLFHSPTSGGVRRYLEAKHAWIAAHRPDWQHTMLVPGRREARLAGGCSTLRGIPIPGTFNYRLPLNPRAWSRALEALDPDVIEVGDAFHTAWAARGVADRLGLPLVAFYHSNLPHLVGRRYGETGRRVAARYVRATYARFDRVFAPSRFMCDYLRSLGVEQVRHQPLGVDTRVFHPSRRQRDLRAELGLPRGARLLVFAGRFSQEKRIGVLREAFRQLGKPYQLVLLGGAEMRQLDENVCTLPFKPDSRELAGWLASADAFVHAGTEETFGLVVLEAMACGRPVVATRASAMPELVDDAVGLLARPDDPADLAAAIAGLYDADLEAMGRAARAHVLARFTWTQTFSELLARYATLLGRAPAAPAGTPADPVPSGATQSLTISNTVSFPLRSPTATWRPSGDQRTHEGSESVR
jgi:alpha-1,6-mannosyltransferase